MSSKKYTNELLIPIVAKSNSFAEVGRTLKLNYGGGTLRYIKKCIVELGIDTSHFTGCGYLRGTISSKRKPANKILTLKCMTTKSRTPTYQLVRALKEIGIEYNCSICSCGDLWNGKLLTLQVDHIDGNPYDDRKENLRFICPNCHTQTNTFGSKNIKTPYVPKKKQYFCKCGAEIKRTSYDCVSCSSKKRRKVINRPSKELLLEQLNGSTYVNVGLLYGVSNKTIKNWLK